MKLWIVMVFVMLFIVSSGIYLEQSILKTTERLSYTLDQIQDHVRKSQWFEAQELCLALDQEWSKHSKFWGPFIHNHDLDVVKGQLQRLMSFLETEDQGHALAETNTIRILFVQLEQQEVFSLENIL